MKQSDLLKQRYGVRESTDEPKPKLKKQQQVEPAVENRLGKAIAIKRGERSIRDVARVLGVPHSKIQNI